MSIIGEGDIIGTTRENSSVYGISLSKDDKRRIV